MRSRNSWGDKDVLMVALAWLSRLCLGGLAVCPLLAASSGSEGSAPENQKESDWVDARWSQTDLGNFHASVLALPGGPIAKGLSIRVGEHGEAAVAYDTGSASLRAGWTNGFLIF